MTNNDKLRQAMINNNLDNRTVSALSGYSIFTIRSYMLPMTSKARRNVPNRALELILHKIGSMGSV